MLKVAGSPGEIRVFELMDVYAGSEPDRSFSEFYGDLTFFFHIPDAKYMLWELEGRYVTALRVEPYRDGFLIAGLETAPQYRRQGCATQLLDAALQWLTTHGAKRIYSHVAKNNTASQKVHTRCGFVTVADHAVLLDGSVSARYVTLCKNYTADTR